MRAPVTRLLTLLFALLLIAAAVEDGDAQPAVCPDRVDCDLSGRSSQALILAANALMGGASAGVTSAIRGEPFWPAFRGGVMGGVVTFAGKRLAVEQFDGAGFLGRQVAAVGSSMSYNAATGSGLLSEVMVPFGPARLYLRTGHDPSVRARVDLYSSLVLMHTLLDSDLELDVRQTLSSGAFVFRDTGDDLGTHWLAKERAGLVRINQGAWARHAARHPEIHAHERVHVLQYDQAHMLIGAPLQRLVEDLVPAAGRVTRWIDLGLDAGFWAAANGLVPYDHRPWEREASILSGAHGGHRTQPRDSRILKITPLDLR